MTIHQPISAADRTLLPRGLIQRRKFVNTEYVFEFEMGQRVTLECTGELAEITGRIQVSGCIDEYIIELVDVACGPLRVFDYEITDAH